MRTRLGSSLAMLVVGVVLLAAAVGARRERLGEEGWHAPLVVLSDVDSVDPALGYAQIVDDRDATCAKLFNYPDRAGAAGARVIPRSSTGSPSRRTAGSTRSS